MKKVLKVALINLITVLVLLILVNQVCGYILSKDDGAARHLLPNFDSDQQYAEKVFSDYNSIQHSYKAFVGWRTREYHGETTNINKLGIREHDESSELSDSSSVIRFFGGSTMWGEGSDDNHTIPALFHQQNPTTKTINHGQLAYNSRQNLESLISLYNKGERSDIVVFYDGVNDAAFLCPTEVQVPGHRLEPVFQQKLYISKKDMILQLTDKIFTEKIRHYVSNSRESDASAAYNCISDPLKAQKIADFMISNWEIAHNLVEDQGGKFYAILQPMAFIGTPRLDHLKLDTELGKNMSKVYALIRAHLEQKKYDWVIDLTDSFNSDEYIYIDFCHISPNGNQIISHRLTDFLKEKSQL